MAPLLPGRYLPGRESGARPYAPPDTEFPAPYMLGGPKPKLNPPPGSGRPEIPPPASLAATPITPGQALSNPAGMPPSPPEASAAANPAQADAPKKPSKPIQIDPALLERTLMNRYMPQ